MIRIILLLVMISFPVSASVIVHEVKTDIGINAYLVENKTNPIISVRINFATGNVNDGINKQGLSDLYAMLLSTGAGENDSEEFQEKLYGNSISLGFSAYTEDFKISLKTLKENYKTAFMLLRDSLEAPHLENKDIENFKKQIITSIKIKQEQPKNEIFSLFKKEIFGNHPLGFGDEDVLRDIGSITKKDLKNYKKRFAKDNIIIGVSGDITPQELKQIIEETFAFLPAVAMQEKPVVPEFIKNSETVVVKRDSRQSAVMFGVPWVMREDKDFFTSYLLNYIFGGAGLNSVLMQDLREKQGLTYGISSFVSEYDKISVLMGYGVSSPDKALPLIDRVKNVVANLMINQKQLDDAKSYLIGAFPLTFASAMATAELLVVIQKYNLGLDYINKRNEYINAVTLENINELAKKYLSVNNINFIMIGEIE